MEAYLYDALPEDAVKCNLCHHRCRIAEGQRGICNVRENRSGKLYTLVFDKVIARHADPIEKKPLFHFYPGTAAYSVATVGCNFRCRFCQNADIAQMPSDQGGRILGDGATPREIVSSAERNGCRSIAYTYTEPTVYFELAFETAKLAHERGIKNVFVTNGYMSTEALEMIQPYLDAANVDLKAFSGDFYRSYCGARLDGVKKTLLQMRDKGIFIEVTTLLIPELNDRRSELASLAAFLRDGLGPDVPWHISRFHPTYRLLDRPATPLAALTEARQIGLDAGLRYVYTGNVPGEEGENTFCHNCGSLLIDRWGFTIRQNRITDGKCYRCRTPVGGLGM